MFDDFLAETIDESVIEDCERDRACDPGLDWLREKPRTFGELRAYNILWWLWLATHCSHPAVLEKLAGDSDKYVRRSIAANPNTPVAVREKLRRELNA